MAPVAKTMAANMLIFFTMLVFLNFIVWFLLTLFVCVFVREAGLRTVFGGVRFLCQLV